MLSVLQESKKPQKPQVDFHSLYLNAFIKFGKAVQGKSLDNHGIRNAVYYGVKLVGHMDKMGSETEFEFIECIRGLISTLTPNELMQIFPIKKDYDGERWGVKDYFYSMNVLRKHGLDTPIGEAINHILWDYMNHDIMSFESKYLSTVSKLHKAETGRDVFLDAFEEISGKRLTTYTQFTDTTTGNEYMRNNDTGEIMRIRKPKPRYLKVIKAAQTNCAH